MAFRVKFKLVNLYVLFLANEIDAHLNNLMMRCYMVLEKGNWVRADRSIRFLVWGASDKWATQRLISSCVEKRSPLNLRIKQLSVLDVGL